MTWLFWHVFLYCLAAFLLGVVLTWFFLARPRKKNISVTEERIGAADTAASGAAASVEAGADAETEADAPAADVEAPQTVTDADPPSMEAELTTPDVDAGPDGSEAAEPSAGSDAGSDAVSADADVDVPAATVAEDATSAETESGSPAAATATLVAPADSPADSPATAAHPRFGEGSAMPLEGGAAPSDEFTIKGNEDSMLYHTTESPYYGRTIAEVWFRTEEDAARSGFTAWNRRRRRK